MTPRSAGLPPVAREDARLLVLGSLPGAASLTAQRYYAHPRNQFWALMGRVIGRDLTALDGEDRLAALVAARVALWDVVASAERLGSLDAAIRAPELSDLAKLVARLPDLRAVAFNGATAWKLGTPQLATHPGLALIPLPSSSPANAQLPIERKAERWAVLRQYLLDPAPASSPPGRVV